MAFEKRPFLGIVMDPLASIKPKKDSTVAMMEAANNLGWTSFYMGIDDLFVEGGIVKALTCSVDFTGDDKQWYRCGERQVMNLRDFGVIMMRKDPPVDKRFIHACYMLEQAKQQGVRVINNPTSLIALNEKLFAGHFPDFVPPTLVACDIEIVRSFLEKYQKIILKPLDAMGGAGVFMIENGDVNFEVAWELLTQRGSYPVIAQEFLPSIAEGDARVLVISGKPFSHALVRTPKHGSVRGNMAAGGSYAVRLLTTEERQIAEVVGERLKELGIVFAGLDIIGGRLIEINITSPTGIRQISKACGVDVANLLMKDILES